MFYKINRLLNVIVYQFNLIKFLVSYLGISIKPKPELPDNLKYHHFKVDQPPIIDNP